MQTAAHGLRVGEPKIALVQGVDAGPPPPLAGALAAWVLRAGGAVRVLDRRGEAREQHGDGGTAGWPLWIHVQGGDEAAALAWAEGVDAPTFFGPGVDGEGGRQLLRARADARIVRGDPELGLASASGSAPPLLDLATLPLTTFAGFGAQPGGLFRLLAGRGARARPVAAVVREIVYLVETHRLGHVRFEDADLSALEAPGPAGAWAKGGSAADPLHGPSLSPHPAPFLVSFEVELTHLPWRITWEGKAGGVLVFGGGQRASRCSVVTP